MLIMVAIIAAVFVLSYLFTTNQEQLIEQRAPLIVMGVQIICGDCSGDGEIPVKTYLNRSGNCDQCGGHSYVLASDLALRSLHSKSLTARHKALKDGSVIPFEIPESRIGRTAKVAV